MKVKIIEVLDKLGNSKDEWIWGQERILEINAAVALLAYTDGTKLRKTSLVEKVVIYEDKIIIHTLNSIYRLEVISI